MKLKTTFKKWISRNPAHKIYISDVINKDLIIVQYTYHGEITKREVFQRIKKCNS